MKKERKLYLLFPILLGILLNCVLHINVSRAEIIYKKDKENIQALKLVGLLNESEVNFFEPGVSFKNVDNKRYSLQDFRGKVVVVYFWATYCNECVESLKSIKKMTEDMAFKGIKNIEVLPISVDYKSAERVVAYLLDKKIDLPVFIDKGRKLMDEFQANEIPATFIINADGYVINRIKKQIDFENVVLLDYLQALSVVEDEKVVETNVESNIINKEINGIKNEHAEYKN